jgi:hypothetical protein
MLHSVFGLHLANCLTEGAILSEAPRLRGRPGSLVLDLQAELGLAMRAPVS